MILPDIAYSRAEASALTAATVIAEPPGRPSTTHQGTGSSFISAALDSSLDLPARVEAAVEAWLDFAGARPTLMRLFMREVAGSEGGLRPEVQQFVDPMFARLVGTLDEGCRTNTFRAIDPVQFWSILAGASMFFIMDAPLLANAETVARLDTYKQELKRVARHMLGTGETA